MYPPRHSVSLKVGGFGDGYVQLKPHEPGLLGPHLGNNNTHEYEGASRMYGISNHSWRSYLPLLAGTPHGSNFDRGCHGNPPSLDTVPSDSASRRISSSAIDRVRQN